MKSMEFYYDLTVLSRRVDGNKAKPRIIVEVSVIKAALSVPRCHSIQPVNRSMQRITEILYRIVQGVIELPDSELDS